MARPVMMPVIYSTKPHWRQYDIIFVRLEWSVALMRNTHLRNIQLCVMKKIILQKQLL